MYLADTNIVSELMRVRPNAGVLQWAGSVDGAGAQVAVSAMTVDEIIFGLKWRPNAAKMNWFDRFLADTAVLPVTEVVAHRGGEMRAVLATRGQVREQADMLIAATAQVHALTLVTRNVRDFDGCGIAVLNPFSPA